MLNNITAAANTPNITRLYAIPIQQLVKINNLTMPTSLQIIENDGDNEFIYDYNNGAVFAKAREFKFTIKGGYRYNITLNKATTLGNLQIFYRRE